MENLNTKKGIIHGLCVLFVLIVGAFLDHQERYMVSLMIFGWEGIFFSFRWRSDYGE